jgi:molybdate transport system substrate-binding protein
VLASNGIKAAFVEIAPQFEKATGHRVNVMWDASNFLFKKIEDGQAFDVVIISPDLVAKLAKSGKVAEDSTATLARAGLGVAVRDGAPKPDISSAEAFKQTLLAAKAIAYTTSGLSGVQFMRIAEQLGIADQVKAKGKTVPAGASAEFVAKGEADVAVQLIPELASVRRASRRPVPEGAADLHRSDRRDCRKFA